ncbi:hypothetical protein MACJ_002386 [Theileria orientalis]|uniref:SfiI-subtelomeric related protein family member n=1 Tax=Theileria orientalis TaxID=68886 RepID=A0A976QSA6_THEOR|nr:hypothetical protein MACJ_002386 [Theileria orientalis]
MKFHTLLTFLIIHFLCSIPRNLVDSVDNGSVSIAGDVQSLADPDCTSQSSVSTINGTDTIAKPYGESKNVRGLVSEEDGMGVSHQSESNGSLNDNNNNNGIKVKTNNSKSSSVASPNSTPSTKSDPKKPTTLKSIELDVKNTKSTETFDCLKKDGFAKYTPKTGYGFSSVKGKAGGCSDCCGSSVAIWDAKVPTDYATEVVRDGTGSCKSMNNVTIFFGNNHRHFTKFNKIFVQDSDIRLYGNGPSDTSTQLAATEYSEDHSDDVFKFTFNDATKCTGVKFVHRSLEKGDSANVVVKEVSVWKHDSTKHGEQYPIVFRYYWPDKILINFQNFFIIFCKSLENKWDEGHLFDFKLYGKGTDNNSKAFDLKSYELTQEKEEYLFTFKNDVKLLEVKNKGNELWKHDTDKHGDKYPQLVRYTTDKLALSFDESFMVYIKDGEGKWDNGRFFDFKLYGKGSDNNLKELGVTAYDIADTNNDHVFKFKAEHNCVMVKHKGNELWKHDSSKHGNKCPLTLRYKRDGSKLLIDSEVFFVLCTKDGDKLKANEFFDLDISSTNSAYHYQYKNTIHSNTFTMKEGVLCGLIKFGDKKIYKPFYPHERVLKVVLHKTVDSEITYGEVFFTNQCVKRFEKLENSDEWYIKLSPFPLDVKWKDDTCYYKYSFNNNVSSYITKENFGFRRVRFGLKNVWQSDSVTDYAYKVEMTETDKTAKLEIHLHTGEKKVFNVRKDPYETGMTTTSALKNSTDPNVKPAIPDVPPTKLRTQQ